MSEKESNKKPTKIPLPDAKDPSAPVDKIAKEDVIDLKSKRDKKG